MILWSFNIYHTALFMRAEAAAGCPYYQAPLSPCMQEEFIVSVEFPVVYRSSSVTHPGGLPHKSQPAFCGRNERFSF